MLTSILLLLVDIVDCGQPVFNSASPRVVSPFGGNTLSIGGSDFPILVPGSEILCKWQDSLVIAGTYVSETQIECPVPSVFRFVDFTDDTDYHLNDLKISFDTFTEASLVVISPEATLGLTTRLIQDELAPLSVRPYRSFASYEGLELTVTWSNLPLYPEVAALCRFTLINKVGRYGKFQSVDATILNSTTLSCTAPTLGSIDPSAVAPAQTLIHVSLDGGQTWSNPQTVFSYLPDILVSSVSPVDILDIGGTWVTLTGSGFINTPTLSCRFQQGSTDLRSSHVRFLNDSAISCQVPFVESLISLGLYEIHASLDGEHFVDTNAQVTAIPSPSVAEVFPARGYYYGGTLVNVTGENIKNDTEATQCVFGEAPTRMYNFINASFIQCLAPACTLALGSIFTASDPRTCAGEVLVSVITTGPGFGGLSGSLSSGGSFTYVAEQKILGFDPWYASAWNEAFPVGIFGKGLTEPLFCQWLDLPPVVASNIKPLDPLSNAFGANSFAECTAPILPESYRPSVASGLDSLLGSVEISCNDQDYTRDRIQWLFISPPSVASVSPDRVWAGSVRTGGIFVKGSNFRAVNLDALACMWYYDLGKVEYTPARFIDKSTVFCEPVKPAGTSMTFVRVEVRVTPGIFSSSNIGLTVVPAPAVSSVSSRSGLAGPYLGGDILTLKGSNIVADDLYIVVGDSPVAPSISSSGDLTIPVPPSLLTGTSLPVTLVVNKQDRMVIGQYSYTTVPAGNWYRPTVHKGIITPCSAGEFCGGGYPSNDSLAFTSVNSPQRCPPGSFQSSTGATGCVKCPSPSFCPSIGQARPSTCPPGRVCWDRSGNDNELSICPIGSMCLLSDKFALPFEIPVADDPFRQLTQIHGDEFRRLLGSDASTARGQDEDLFPMVRSLLQSNPPSGNDLVIIPCPSGYVCGPGTTGIYISVTGSIVFDTSAISCSLPGVYCAPGSGSPISTEVAVPEGAFVSEDGSTILQCPVGYSCEFGFPSPCGPGSYQSSLGSSTCLACQGGTVCTGVGSVAPSPCPAGYVCSLPGRFDPTYPCPAGSFCLELTVSLIPSSSGNPMPYQPVKCPEGTYCASGTGSATADPADPTAPRPCASGFFCGEGSTDFQGSGECPIGYYCPVGSVDPVQAPPGTFVNTAGAYTPTNCAPGYYQDLFGQTQCKPCPDGFECPVEGMDHPIACAPAHYRSNTDSTFSEAENVMCHPCQEGTWNWRGQLKSSAECIVCPERYVCGRPGMQIFATKDQTDCTPNSDGVSICYAYSQASDCPEGYACDPGTTSFTQYNYPCEPGYFCRPLTALREMKNLLCPAGYVCKSATGGSQAYSYVCPAGSFCPEGTGSINTPDGTEILYNVQGMESPSSRGAVKPFEAISIPIWDSLKCPDGTTSKRGSVAASDCVQEGITLAVVNIYNRTESVYDPWTNASTPLWRSDFEEVWMSNNPGSKQSYLNEDFLAFDPRIEELEYQSIALHAMDMMKLDIDFSKLSSDFVLSTDGNDHRGGYLLTISSDQVDTYTLPYSLTSGDGMIQSEFALKLFALTEKVDVNVSVALLDGSHLKNLHKLNDALSVSILTPQRAEVGTRKAFLSVVSSGVLDSGGYELPYNMIPTLANQPGEESLAIDLDSKVNYTVNSQLVETMIPGTVFWQVIGASTVASPWLPFFSNCDYLDRHIVLWDVLEGNTRLPLAAGECYLTPGLAETVAPLIIDFETGRGGFQPSADWCELALTCRYEDNLKFHSGDPIPWMVIPGTGTDPLFYLTQDPWDMESGFIANLGEFDALESTDALVAVALDASQRTGKFPRLIQLAINYAQISKTQKRIISATVTFNDFDDDDTRSDYLLQLSFEPMNWVQLMNNFVLPWYVYIIVFVFVGFSVVGLGIGAWLVLKLISALKSKISPRMPRFQILDCYKFFMSYTIQGVVVGSLPAAFIVGFIKLIMLPSVGLLKSVPCVWDRGPSTSESSIPSASEEAVCNSIRTGTCLIVSGVLTLWTASRYFAPRLPEVHTEYLEAASKQKLQEDGISSGTKKSAIETVILWKRIHIFFTSLLVACPLMVLFYFSYSAMFGTFTVYYAAGYTITMMFFDLLYIKVARDKSTFNYLAIVTDVVFFVATLSAADLNGFVLSYLFGPFFTVIQRLIAEDVISHIYTTLIPGAIAWVKSRRIVWKILTGTQRVLRWLRHEPRQYEKPEPFDRSSTKSSAIIKGDVPVLEFSDVPAPVVRATAVKSLGDIDDDIDQISGVASRTASLVFAPFAILLLWVFATETQFAANYGLKTSSIPFYLLFSVIVIPFQIALEITINHAFDATRGTRIYDYMYLSIHRWKTRLTRWMLDDARLDSSLGESTQALHHLAFSPQFYFITTFAVNGGVFVTYGVTCWIANGTAAFWDPATSVFVLLILVAQRFADALSRWLVFYVMWKPADRAPEKAFVQSIALGMKQRELGEHEVAFRNFFFKRHREWIIENLDKVYTPRGISKYRTQLSDIYNKVLSIRIPYLYTAPVKKPTAFGIERPTDDVPEDMAAADPGAMFEVPLDSDDEAIGGEHAIPITYSLVQGWLEVARRRVRRNQMGKKGKPTIETNEDPVETFVGPLTVNLSDSSRAMISQWFQQARRNINR